MRFSAVAACLAAVLLAACAVVPMAPRDPNPFDLLGRVLVAYDGGALTANVRWEHSAGEDQIWLMTPTGQTLARIVDTAEGATLTRADQQQHRARSVEELTRRALGWPLPLGLLQYWVRGAAAPGEPPSAVERGAGNRLASFVQHGWNVALVYHTEGEHSGLVRRVDLRSGANEIRFVIDTWRSEKER